MTKINTDLIQQPASGGARDVSMVIAVNADGSPISGGGGAGGGTVEVSNFPSSQPVTGPLTNAQFTAVTGAATAAMWDGEAASATIIAILKTMHEQGEALKRIGNEANTLLVQIAQHTRDTALNTDPAGE